MWRFLREQYTHHVREDVAVGFLRDATVRYLDPGRRYVGCWVVQEEVHPFPANETKTTTSAGWVGRNDERKRPLKSALLIKTAKETHRHSIVAVAIDSTPFISNTDKSGEHTNRTQFRSGSTEGYMPIVGSDLQGPFALAVH